MQPKAATNITGPQPKVLVTTSEVKPGFPWPWMLAGLAVVAGVMAFAVLRGRPRKQTSLITESIDRERKP